MDSWIQQKVQGAWTVEDKAQAFSQINKQFIEESHLLPFERGFKPYVAYGSEYITVSASSTYNRTSGGQVDFSLPVAGDFISDSVF